MTALEKVLVPERIIELRSTEKDAILRELVDVIARSPGMPGREALLQAMLEREALMPTGIGHGIAIPHCKDPRIKNFVVALGRSKGPVDYGSSDKQPVRLVAMIAAPDSRQDEYLRLLSRVTKFLKNERQRLLDSPNLKDVHEVVAGY
jgi:mannitol/fructose-specific phosphotransferase system IIA component (Ntr-type)